MFLAFYGMSIRYAAERSLEAFEMFEAQVVHEADAHSTFASIQEALTHAAALSRFFWPVGKKNRLAQARGKRLREVFAMSEDSALRFRGLRNAFEHYDENLDRYLLEAPVGCFFPTPQVGNHELADEPVGNIFKLVDPKAGVCVLLGQKFEYRAVQREIEYLLNSDRQKNKDGNLR